MPRFAAVVTMFLLATFGAACGGSDVSAADVAKVATAIDSCETVNAGFVGADDIEAKRDSGDTMVTSDDGELGIQVVGDAGPCEQEIKDQLNALQ